jgi:hypothetical protein
VKKKHLRNGLKLRDYMDNGGGGDDDYDDDDDG